MKRSVAVALFALPLLLTSMHRGDALTVETQLTPENRKDQPVSFQVETKDAGAFRQVEVTVAMKEGKLSPILTARLHLREGETEVATVPVEEKWSGTKVTYWFRIASKWLPDSKFEWNEHFGTAETDAKGKRILDEYGRPRFIAVPGTRGYWFYLKDFVKL